MAETLKERKDMDPAYMWDLSTLYKDDETWAKEKDQLEDMINQLSLYQGTLNNAKNLRTFFDFDTKLSRKLSDYYCYASLRNCEDTRNNDGQAMEAKAFEIYTKYATAISFAEPEILSLDEKTMEDIMQDALLKPYQFTMQKLLDAKPHVLSSKEEALLAAFTEVLGAPGKIS